MTRTLKTTNSTGKTTAPSAPEPSKLDRLLAELARDDGATIDQLVVVTGWQRHSVRGAMAGTLKRKGHLVASTKADGVRRYRLVPAA